jgi:hypothetical protein
MEKANPDDFVPVFVLGMYKDNPAIRTLEYEEGLTSTQIAGFLTAIIDCMVDMVEEKDQTQYEEDILSAFQIFVENRHSNTNKYSLEE